jgi:hypothetical protein
MPVPTSVGGVARDPHRRALAQNRKKSFNTNATPVMSWDSSTGPTYGVIRANPWGPHELLPIFINEIVNPRFLS